MAPQTIDCTVIISAAQDHTKGPPQALHPAQPDAKSAFQATMRAVPAVEHGGGLYKCNDQGVRLFFC